MGYIILFYIKNLINSLTFLYAATLENILDINVNKSLLDERINQFKELKFD